MLSEDETSKKDYKTQSVKKRHVEQTELKEIENVMKHMCLDELLEKKIMTSLHLEKESISTIVFCDAVTVKPFTRWPESE